MKIFKDKELKEEINEIKFGVVEAGKSIEKTLYLYNDTKANLKELKYSIEHPEIEIVEGTKEIEAGKTGILKIKWVPSLTLKEGLRTKIKILGEQIWG